MMGVQATGIFDSGQAVGSILNGLTWILPPERFKYYIYECGMLEPFHLRISSSHVVDTFGNKELGYKSLGFNVTIQLVPGSFNSKYL